MRPATKTAVHVKPTPQQLAELGKTNRMGVDLDPFLKAGGKRNGAATIDGVKCEVYTLKDKAGLL